jgi:quinol monooxygenase YgiN
MATTIHVIARVRSKEGKEEALKAVLTGLIAPSRREIACYQYDLLQSTTDRRDFCFVERWDNDAGLNEHAASVHVKRASEQIADLVEAPPEIQRFEQL